MATASSTDMRRIVARSSAIDRGAMIDATLRAPIWWFLYFAGHSFCVYSGAVGSYPVSSPHYYSSNLCSWDYSSGF